MYIDDAIEIKKPEPDSHFRLIPCGNCHGDNVAWMRIRRNSGSAALIAAIL